MSRSRSLVLIACSALVVAVIGLARSAEPGQASGASESFTLSTSTGAPGSKTIVSGVGFGASEIVQFKFDTIARGSVTTNAAGSFSKKITVPATGAGIHTIAATGMTSAAKATLTFVVPPPDLITVTPTNPSIPSGTQQFSATGTWGVSSFAITKSVMWASSSPNIVRISNDKGSRGLATSVNKGAVTISATTGGVTGSTTLTVECGWHENGLGQQYADCSPLGTYNLTTATEAGAAWEPPTTPGVTEYAANCGGGATASQVWVVQTPTAAAAWAYSGYMAGHVALNTSSNDANCPGPSSMVWN